MNTTIESNHPYAATGNAFDIGVFTQSPRGLKLEMQARFSILEVTENDGVVLNDPSGNTITDMYGQESGIVSGWLPLVGADDTVKVQIYSSGNVTKEVGVAIEG